MAQALDYYLPGIQSTDTHKRLGTYLEIVSYLDSADCVVECDDLDQVVEGLAAWCNSSNYKIALNGLELLGILVRRLKERFKPYITSVLPSTIDRIGDSKDSVRDAAIQLVVKLQDVSSPQYVFDRMASAFSHKLWRVREGVMLCLQSSLNIYGAKSLTLSKLVPSICKLLDDQNSSVRETALNTLVDVYCHVGERVRADLGKKNISATKLATIYAKFDEARDAGRMNITTDTASKSSDSGLVKSRPASAVPTSSSSSTTATNGVTKTAARSHSFKASSSSAGAGGVDEESFQQSFTEVPKVNFFSPRELSDHIQKIKDTLSDDKIDWEKRVEALKMVRSLIINGALGYDDFLQQLRTLEACFQLSVKDLRSQIVREACISIAYMSNQLGNKFDHFGEAVLPNLITLIPNTVKVMATSGIVCVQMLLQFTHSQRFVPIIVGNLTSKSSTIRKYCFEFLEQMLATWPTHPLERHIAIIQDSIKKGMNDADAEARAKSRKAYWGFAGHFKDQADSLLLSLDSSKQRMLQGEKSEMSNSSSNNSLNNAAAQRSVSAKPRVRSQSTDRGTTGISGLTKRRPQGSATLGPSRVARTPQKSGSISGPSEAYMTPRHSAIPRSSSDLDLSSPRRPYLSKIGRPNNTPYRSLPRDKSVDTVDRSRTPVQGTGIPTPQSGDARSRSRSRIGVSQSQPSSRSSSPSSRLSYLTYQRQDQRRDMTGSRIPRSQGTSRETSPNRGTARKLSTPGRVPTHGVLSQNILGKNSEAEQALANALLKTASRSRYDQYDSDDAMSETSSICSDRSYGSYGGRTSEEEYGDYRPHPRRRKILRVRRDVGSILTNMSSGSWADRKDGLAQLQQLMQTTRLLNKLEVKKVTEIFTRMFHEPHNKVFCVFMETLVDFIYIYKDCLNDWLHVLLVRLLTKLGAELLGSVTMKIQRALDAVRDNFQYDHQFSVITKFIIDSTQTPTNKLQAYSYTDVDLSATPTNIQVRAGILNYLHSLVRLMDPSDLVVSTDTKLAVTRIITWTSEPKSVEVRKSASAVIISLFDLNSPEFSAILSEIPKSFQETATRILHSHLKNTSAESDVLAPRSVTTPGSAKATARARSQTRRHRDQYETENMNPEEIYNSICQTSADIQNLNKLDHHFDDIRMAKERDSTSQDSGIQSSLPDLRDGLHGNQVSSGGYNPSHYQDGQGDINGMKTSLMAEGVFDDDIADDFTYDENDPLADILAELSNHSQRSKERNAAMTKLKRIIADTKTDYAALWDEHFKNVLFVLLEMLADEDPEFRVRAMNRLQDLITHHGSRLGDYVELVILRVMEAHKDPERKVQIAAEACAPGLGAVIQSEQSLKCLQDFIRPGKFPANYTAIKIQNKAIEKMDRDLLVTMLPEIVPELVKGCDHDETFVRKASVFCLVSVYMVVGEALTDHLKDLRGSKLKLLNLYITREQKKRAVKSASMDDNAPSAKLPLSPTSSEGTLLS